MSSATRQSGVPDSYYAPEFRIDVDGVALDRVSKDVLEIRVVMGLEEVTSVDLKLNNYDDRTFDLKWSESDELKVGGRLHVQLGYADRLVSIVTADITTLSPDFPSEGAPTMTVRALDRLARLKDSNAPEDETTFLNKTDWQIVQAVAARHKLTFEHKADGPVRDKVMQRGLDDLAFLRERAALLDCDALIQLDGSGKDVLHFQTPADGRGASPMRTYRLAWGSLRNTSVAPSLIEFKPTISASDQVQSVTVRGWNAETTTVIKATYPESSPAAPATPGAAVDDPATAAGDTAAGPAGKRQVVVNRPVTSDEQALSLAKAIFNERTYDFFTASGRTIGLPDLRPGDSVEIDGVGARFSGEYYVTNATHVLNSSGYVTEFDVRRNKRGDGR